MTLLRTRVLRFISVIAERGHPSPSYDAMAAALDTGKTASHRAVHQLLKAGLLARDEGQVRSLRLTLEGERALGMHPRLPDATDDQLRAEMRRRGL